MGTAAAAWAEALASWAIPPEILAAAPEDPWAYPIAAFVRAADQAIGRDTPSYRRALEALPVGGSVLDVGCGAGAAGLPLVPPAAWIVGVDQSEQMLKAFAERAGSLGIAHDELLGAWPDVSAELEGAADVAVCHHVLYNVPDIEPFVRELARRAMRRCVIEITAEHPRAWEGPLWKALQGLDRPTRPTAVDAVAAIRETGIDPKVEIWPRPMTFHAGSVEERIATVRVDLCLPPERDADIARALAEHPPPEARNIATIWWDTSEK